jgi:hypothetical protein
VTGEQHPAHGGSSCDTPGCGQRATARVCLPLLPDTAGPGLGFTIIRPADSPVTIGELACLDCAHAAVDDMLMNATAPGPGPAIERAEDGAP